MTRPDHLFLSFDGSLYDTRDPDWSKKNPLRERFSYHHRVIANAHELKAVLRAGSTTDMGGYPLYFVCADGDALSFEAARDNLRNVLEATTVDYQLPWGGWKIVGIDINYENPTLFCAHTNKRIASAYAEDEAAVFIAKIALDLNEDAAS